MAPGSLQQCGSALASLLLTIQPRVLVRMPGSGNFGEQTNEAAFYTVDRLPDALLGMSGDLAVLPKAPTRRDIDIGPGGLAFVIDDILTSTEADAVAACGEAIFKFNNHSRFAPGIQTPPGMRQNMAAHWFPTPAADATAFVGAMYGRFKHLLPQTVGGRPLSKELNQKIAIFKYGAGDQFKPHTDGVFPGQAASADGAGVEGWDGLESGLSMLLYLNDFQTDGLQGGETRLFNMGGTSEGDGQHTDVTPRKGSALFFRHGAGRDSVLHASLPVTGLSAVPKCMARMNVLFGTKKGVSRLY
jgi:hypothetical protein